jgi:hypothetical protein
MTDERRQSVSLNQSPKKRKHQIMLVFYQRKGNARECLCFTKEKEAPDNACVLPKKRRRQIMLVFYQRKGSAR